MHIPVEFNSDIISWADLFAEIHTLIVQHIIYRLLMCSFTRMHNHAECIAKWSTPFGINLHAIMYSKAYIYSLCIRYN